MGEIVKKEVCECKNCGNEAEMVVTCTLPEVEEEPKMAADSDTSKKPADQKRVMGTATCSHCGNEAEMWIDL
jgi:DNA-directed RNA polymerase subunit M/transcription elongation factor TFIIS